MVSGDVFPVPDWPPVCESVDIQHRLHSAQTSFSCGDSPLATKPYEFVAVSTSGRVSDTPQGHATLDLHRQVSGELRCTLESLTPLLAANDQVEFAKLSKAMQVSIGADIDQRIETAGPNLERDDKAKLKEKVDKKKVLMPFCLTGDPKTGPVAISGTSMKGSIRNDMAALLSSPLERVQERTFSMRPNMAEAGFRAERCLEPAPIVIVGVEIAEKAKDDRLIFHWLQNQEAGEPHEVVFVNSHVDGRSADPKHLKVGAEYATENSKAIFANRITTKCFVEDHKSKTSRNGPATVRDYAIVRYLNGLDTKGTFAEAFPRGRRGYEEVLVDKYSDIENSLVRGEDRSNPLSLFDDTISHIQDDVHGHLNDHPLDINAKTVSRNLTSLTRAESYRGLIGCLMYLEVDTVSGEFVSLGHHYRYRRAYRDTIRHSEEWKRADTPPGSIAPDVREILCPTADELTPGRPTRLTAARGLFGFVGTEKGEYQANKDEPLTFGMGVKQESDGENVRTDFSQLAGRIAVGMAVERVGDGAKMSDRFLASAHQHLILLRPLSSPKPSAVENYLQQDGVRQDASTLITYGDSANDPSGQLGGRKHYVHQPAARTRRELYELLPLEKGRALCLDEKHRQALIADDLDMLGTEQSNYGQYISRPGAKFGCTIRFVNLRIWEYAALRLVLEPTAANCQQLVGHLLPHLSANAQQAWQAETRSWPDKSSDANDPVLASKLGHGRPLGMGSIRWRVEEDRRLVSDDAMIAGHDFSQLSWDTSDRFPQALGELAEFLVTLNREDDQFSLDAWFAEVWLAWIRVHRFAGLTASPYPRAESRGSYTVYNYHTNIRRNHAKARKTAK